LALEALEKGDLHHIWLLPTPLSPFKMSQQLTPYDERVALLEIMIRGLESITICRIEEELPFPSYTFNTVKHLKERYPDQEFTLVLADELLEHFHQWKMPEALMESLSFFIGTRSPESAKKKLEKLPFDSRWIRFLQESFVETRLVQISATDVRERLKKGLCCRHLVHQEVLDYIYKNQLYSSRLNTIYLSDEKK
jgi:nicotinate-nucleotide adenylyltransferase